MTKFLQALKKVFSCKCTGCTPCAVKKTKAKTKAKPKKKSK